MSELPGSLQPNGLDRAMAREAREALVVLVEQDRAVKVAGADGGGAAVLPQAAARLLLDVLEQLADGETVTVLPLSAELSTQQAAEMLDVSRPFLVGLLERGALPFRKVGTHRRVRVGDLLTFKSREREARHRVLDALAQQGQDLGLGY